MSDRESFRLTPLGRLPVDWDCVPLASLADPMRPVCYGVVQPGPEDPHGVRFIRGGDLAGNRVSSDLRTITPAVSTQYRRTLLRGGEIIIALVGYPGATAIVPAELAGANLARQVGLVALRNKDLAPFVYQFLTSPGGQRAILRPLVGSAQQVINIDALKKVPVPLPPLGEQRRIAEILGAWDEAIEKVQALIQAKQKLKRALMHQLLTPTRRFPQFNGQWKRVRIREVLQEVKRDITWDDDAEYRLISVRRRSGGIFDRGALQGHQIKTKTLKRAQAGDFLISKMQIVHGASALVTPEFEGSYISGSYIALVPKNPERLSVRFFNYLSQLREFYHLTYICSYGVHIEKMTFDLHDFMRAKINLPATLEEQEAVADTLDAVGAEATKLEGLRSALETQKRGLMQKLLTGQVRVSAG